MIIKNISYGVIGSGNHALNVFIPALRESYNSELAGITPSSTLDKRRLFESTDSIYLSEHKVLDMDALLSDASIDVVYISVPNSNHSEIVGEVLKAGKHVLCEKPLCYLEKDIELLEQYNANKQLLCTGFMYRLHPQYQVLRDLLMEEQILEINGEFCYEIDLSTYNIRNERTKGGGALLDIGCYLLDSVRYIFQPEDLSLSINKLSLENGLDTELQILGKAISNKYEVGISFELSQRKKRRQCLEIKTKNKLITLESPFLTPRNKKTSINVSIFQGKKETIYTSPFNQVSAQINLFSESILQENLLTPLSDGIQNSKDLTSLYSDIHSSR